MTRSSRQLVLLLVLPLCADAFAAQTAREPPLRDVLSRAARYVVGYGDAMASVLAEESYRQRLVWRRQGGILEARNLRSEIAFVRLTDSTEWLAFRNVLAVDDVAIPDSAGRLERLFQGGGSLRDQARRIAGDSARYNLGQVTREINVPTLALHFLHPLHREGCRFEKETEEILDGERVWVVRFRERDRGVLIRGIDGKAVPAEGRLWLLPGDGRVVRSELVVKNFGGSGSKGEIVVTYRRDATLDRWVPGEMRERYEGPWTAMPAPQQLERYDIDGVATYSNYRRFTVDVKIR